MLGGVSAPFSFHPSSALGSAGLSGGLGLVAAVDELSGSGLVMCSEERHEEGLEAAVAMSCPARAPLDRWGLLHPALSTHGLTDCQLRPSGAGMVVGLLTLFKYPRGGHAEETRA